MINPQDLYTKAMEAAEDWADKEHAAGVLEDALSTLEGVLLAELKSQGEPTTTAPKLIKKDPRWIDSAKTWREAKRAALIARMKYEQVNRFQDNVRTKESTERALAR